MQRLSTTTSNHFFFFLFKYMTFVPRGIYYKSVSHRFYHSLRIRLLFLCVQCSVQCAYLCLSVLAIGRYVIYLHRAPYRGTKIGLTIISLFFHCFTDGKYFHLFKIAYEQNSSVILNGDAIRNSKSIRYPFIDPKLFGFYRMHIAYCRLSNDFRQNSQRIN